MNSNKKIFAMVVGTIAALIFAGISNVSAADDSGDHNSGLYNLAGVWITTDILGDVWITDLNPTNILGTKYAGKMNMVTFDPTMDGMFPGASLSPLAMTVEKKPHNRFRYTVFGYGVGEPHEVLYIVVGTGIAQVINDDLSEAVGTMAVFGPEQDPFGDEEPLYGCYPQGGTNVRIQLAQPCDLP